jgi:photosystem II stability/assembly factor-like uncharacterized protein
MKTFNRSFIFFFIVFGCFEELSAQDFWQRVTIPQSYPGDFTSFASDSNGTIYATLYDPTYSVGWNGVARSMDDGKTWTQIGLPKTDAWSIAVDAKGRLLVGATYGDMWFTSDSGGNWTHTNVGADVTLYSLVITQSGRIIAGTSGAGMRASNDSGQTWATADSLLSNFYIRALTVAANGTIFAGGDFSEGIYRSTDEGLHWEYKSNGIDSNAGIYTLISNDSGFIYAGSYNGGMYRSTDNGESWMQINNGFAPNEHIRALTIDTKGNIFAGCSGGVFRSTDNGESWDSLNSAISNTTKIIYSVFSKHANHIFMGVSGSGVYTSTDDGNSWNTYDFYGIDMTAMICDRVGDIILGSVLNGIFKSTDHGDDWFDANNGLTSNNVVYSFVIDSINNMYATVENDILKSTDNGLNWANIGFGYPELAAGPGNVIYNGGDFAGEGVLRESTDGGINWLLLTQNTEISGGSWLRGVCGTSPATIYFLADLGLVKTIDTGNTWNSLLQGSYNALLKDNNNFIYVGQDGGIIRSTDGGANWQQIDSGLINTSVACFGLHRNSIYAGTSGGGIFESADNGQHWNAIPNDGLTSLNIQSITFDSSGYVYTKTDSGLFRSAQPLTGVKEPKKSFLSSLSLSQNYPNPFDHNSSGASQATAISFYIPNESSSELAIYNTAGEKVKTLINSILSGGNHTFYWQGTDDSGNMLPSGKYFYVLRVGSNEVMKNLQLIR